MEQNDYLKLGACDKTVISCETNCKGEIDIPAGVFMIKKGAFKGCTSLTSIKIPYVLTKIGEQAFYGCTSLKSIKIDYTISYGDDVYALEMALSRGCKEIADEENPLKSKPKIGDEAFGGCTSLTSIEIPDGVQKIGGKAFSGCSSLTSIEIPNSVTEIGDGAFSGCTSLTSIEIPDSVTTIGKNAFKGCTNLSSVEIPDSVTRIMGDAFEGCTSLKEIIVDEGNGNFCSKDGALYSKDMEKLILYLGREASIEIPDSVTEIGDGAFSGCTNLTSIKIPESVTTIGTNAFNGCTSLTSIDIPDGVSKIEDYAFAGCKSLTSIKIPNSVEYVNMDAFNNCANLVELHLRQKNLNPCDKHSSPENVDISKITLYVPIGTGYAYRHHPFYSKFKEVVIER